MKDKEYGVKLTADIDKFKKKMLEAKDVTNSVTQAIKDKVKNPMEVAGSSGKRSFTERFEAIGKLNDKYRELGIEYLNTVSLEGRNSESANKLKQELKDLAKETEKEVNELNEYSDIMEELGMITDDTNKKSHNFIGIFQNFDGSLKRAVSSIKRFSLSLLGIQSLYSALTKATNAYMSTDETLHNKLQASWIALGSVMAPIIEKLIELFQRFVGYVNVFYYAFTGKDLINRALKNVEKQTNKNIKAQKELNEELATFDEIININMNKGNNNDETSGVPSIEDYLKEMQDIKLNPEIVKVLTWLAEKLKELWSWVKKNKDTIIEVGKVIAVAFAVGKVISFIGKLKKVFDVVSLIGGSSGFGLWALTIVGVVADLKLAYELGQKIVELNDVKKEQKKSEENVANSELKTMKTALGVLKDTTKNEQQKSIALDGAEQTYKQYLIRLKEGKKYTKEQKEEMEKYVQNIEKVSGKTFKTRIQAIVDAQMSGESTKWWENFFARLGSSGGQHSSGGGRHFAKGNVAYKPTVAEFGEYSGANTNPEITAPQNMMRQTLFEALEQALPLVNASGNQEHGDIILNVNGKEFARATYSDYQSEARRMGSSSVAIRRS